jgi:hypothetical protein
MNPILHGVMTYEDISIAKVAKENRVFTVNALQHGSQTYADTANVRVSEPLAIGIEGLSGFFS